jgi:dTDP-glucose 4,6-dehydratase
MSILVTGGAGFIGSNFVIDWLAQSNEPITSFKNLIYASNLASIASQQGDTRFIVRGVIGDVKLVSKLINEHKPRTAVNKEF